MTTTLDTGISNTNIAKFTSGVIDDDFLRVDGTTIEGLSASEVLTNIGAQAAGDILDDLNTLTAPSSDGQFIVATGSGAFAYETTTTAQASLGLGTIATQASDSVNISGGAVAGITDLAVEDGGTGVSALTDNSILTGTGTAAITAEANLTFDGADLLVSNSVSGKPVVTLETSNTTTDTSSELLFQKTATGATDEQLGKISFKGDNDNNQLE